MEQRVVAVSKIPFLSRRTKQHGALGMNLQKVSELLQNLKGPQNPSTTSTKPSVAEFILVSTLSECEPFVSTFTVDRDGTLNWHCELCLLVGSDLCYPAPPLPFHPRVPGEGCSLSLKHLPSDGAEALHPWLPASSWTEWSGFWKGPWGPSQTVNSFRVVCPRRSLPTDCPVKLPWRLFSAGAPDGPPWPH